MSNSNTLEVLKSLETSYLNKRYDETFKLILKNKTIFPKGMYHYNLGTVFAKKKEFAIARYHFEKSIQNGFLEKSVFYNLNSVKNSLKISEETSILSLNNFFFKIKNIPDSAYITTSLTILLVLLLVFIKNIFKLKYWITIVIISIIPYLINNLYLKQFDQGIVLKSSSIKEGPSSIYRIIKKITPGVRLLINQSHNGQHYIVLPKAYEGWIDRKDVGIY